MRFAAGLNTACGKSRVSTYLIRAGFPLVPSRRRRGLPMNGPASLTTRPCTRRIGYESGSAQASALRPIRTPELSISGVDSRSRAPPTGGAIWWLRALRPHSGSLLPFLFGSALPRGSHSLSHKARCMRVQLVYIGLLFPQASALAVGRGAGALAISLISVRSRGRSRTPRSASRRAAPGIAAPRFWKFSPASG